MRASTDHVVSMRSYFHCFVLSAKVCIPTCRQNLLKMASCTDLLGLNNKKLFKDLKKGLAEATKDTRNVLEIKEDVLYVWNAEKCCIQTLNVTAVRAKNEDVPYQCLQPTDPPIFEITNLLINETITQLVLWGSLGVVVVQLPKRWGKEAKFQGGKQFISCLSQNLDICCSQFSTSEVRKVRWHPGSTTDSHLLVLTSDNLFQLYECEIKDVPKLRRSWKVGPTLHSPSKMPNFTSLGDTAVDFDFATPTVKAESGSRETIDVDKVTWGEIEWPILVLRGSGDVLIVCGNELLNQNKTVTCGALSIYPPSADNYGVESCSIMCLQTTPPIVVIAECTGKIYHAILLSENVEEDERKTWSQYGSTYSLHTPEEALYVFECVEMELGLFYNDSDKKYRCPISLHGDPENRSRYFCSHNAGIHVVNVPMVEQLDDYVNANESNIELYLPNLIKNSSAQYLVSTRTKYTSKEESTPVLGFGLLQDPCMLIAILHTGVVIDISVVDFNYIPKVEFSAPLHSPSKKVTKEAFDTHIKQLLKKESSQPITKIGLRNNLMPREYLELLYRATTVFRKQHFIRHDQVQAEIAKKLRILKALKNHQLKELEDLAEMKKYLHEKAGSLAERYEDIKEKQEELARRAEEVLRLVHLKEPTMNAAEIAEAKEIKKMAEKVKELAVRLEQLEKKKALNQALITTAEKNIEKQEIIFNETQRAAITANLTDMGKSIAELVAKYKSLEEKVDL